jgi:predicted Co/Zn/Cd cation transporter (cation efflux family)
MTMSLQMKRAGLVIGILLVLAVWLVITSVRVTGSGGLGAVSVGFSEVVLEFLVLSVAVCLFFFWRHRRQAKRQGSAPRL